MECATHLTRWRDPELKQSMLDRVSIEVSWNLVEGFSGSVGHSGSR